MEVHLGFYPRATRASHREDPRVGLWLAMAGAGAEQQHGYNLHSYL